VGTTASRVALRAGVSPGTFYAHHENVGACLLASYEAAAECVCGIFARSCDEPQVEWSRRLEDGVRQTLRFLAAEPAVAHLLGAEAPAGEPAIAVARERTVGRLAAMLVEGRRRRSEGTGELPAGVERHLVGAAFALVADRLATGEVESLPRLTRPLTDLLSGQLS
jgi:AcrR family transcriptional regulator